MNPVIAQAIGIVAMFFNIFSFQQKKASRIIACQLIGSCLFMVNYFMLGATMGAVLNVAAAVRAFVFLKREKFHADHIAWLIGFCVVYIVLYVLNFTVFGQEPTVVNLLKECLPVIGMIPTNLAFRHNNAKIIRRYAVVASTAWLSYNVIVMSIGAILCEVFSLASIFIAMFRLDRKQNEAQ